MRINEPLFSGEHICLAPIDHEKDPEIEAAWSNDAYYLRMLSFDPARPVSAAQQKKRYEAIEKEQEDDKNLFYFTIRMRKDDRLIGFARLHWIEWSNSAGFVQIGIGDSNERLKGYGSQALRMLLRLAFEEYNLYRLAALIGEYNPVALHVFAKAGFTEEVRRRQALYRDGRRWDLIHMGILRSEWEQANRKEA